MLLDEPFSSLDETLRAQVRAELVGVLRETGTTAVLVTHDQTEALSIGDRVVVMRDGAGRAGRGRPRSVFERPATRFVASFMGDADFLPAHVHDALLTCEIGIVSTLPGWGGVDTDVEVVLRPHEVALRADDPAAAGGPGEGVVTAVEYHGAFVLHTVRLASGRSVRSWQPHAVRHPVGVTGDRQRRTRPHPHPARRRPRHRPAAHGRPGPDACGGQSDAMTATSTTRPAKPAISMITPDPAADEARRRGLRRMRTVAVGLLVFAAVVYVVTRGQDGWLGFVNAGAEASMVGAIADWFAVTALFKHPLGHPDPAHGPGAQTQGRARSGPGGVRRGELPAGGGHPRACRGRDHLAADR